MTLPDVQAAPDDRDVPLDEVASAASATPPQSGPGRANRTPSPSYPCWLHCPPPARAHLRSTVDVNDALELCRGVWTSTGFARQRPSTTSPGPAAAHRVRRTR